MIPLKPLFSLNFLILQQLLILIKPAFSAIIRGKMHINSQHRHTVVFPLFVGLMALSLVPAIVHVEAHLVAEGEWQAVETSIPLSFASGEYGVLEKGGTIAVDAHGIAMQKGAVLMASQSLLSMHVRDVDLFALQGSVFVSTSTDAFTVAALTAPVLLRHDDFRMLIPTGMQGRWTWNSVPTHFEIGAVARAMQNLLPLPADTVKEKVDMLDVTEPLPAQVIASRLAGYSDDSMLTAVLPSLQNTDPWRLMYLSPAFTNAAWVQDAVPDVLALFAFPASDVHPDAVPTYTVAKWEQAFKSLLASSDRPAELMEGLLRASAPLRSIVEHTGYIDRKERYSRAFYRLAQPYADSLSEEARQLLQLWETEGPEKQETANVVASSSSSSADLSIDPTQAVNAAKTMLQQSNALYTLTTKIQSVGGAKVSVSDIAFAGTDGDHLYQFVFDLSTHSVISITRDGVRLPFPMNIEKFTVWVKS